MADQSCAYSKDDMGILQATEVKTWQDSLLHLASVATGKDEALRIKNKRKTQLVAALHRSKVKVEAPTNEVQSRTCAMSTMQAWTFSWYSQASEFNDHRVARAAGCPAAVRMMRRYSSKL